MRKQIRVFLACLILISFAAVQGSALPVDGRQTSSPTTTPKLSGRWQVKFTFAGLEKNLIFESRANGVGVLLLLDTEPDNKAAPGPVPAVWSKLTNDRVSFSGDAELPIGTCCREIGTLIFKGKFDSNNSLSGRFLFVTSVEEQENPFKYRSLVGSFTATRLTGKS